ncbi:hypothetical protein NSK_001178 [Nannochloropsis salina CCMP1776]|uniref:Uncharacterized protein n=1 Tax=Nannochloropsis salina CCMP1776 TaxID=1027361 RepID=A0A4D9D7Z2_9STRA|nr:hypothetical protein NSK_001178 [Nannochloropsis salina CCMP1776]|eukprot:TFJ87831.1 hypothetical protein NSK_001178 [Nannochloropsis salina CCMP1776]
MAAKLLRFGRADAADAAGAEGVSGGALYTPEDGFGGESSPPCEEVSTLTSNEACDTMLSPVAVLTVTPSPPLCPKIKKRCERQQKSQVGLWGGPAGEGDKECSSTLRKIFRHALGQVLGLSASYHVGEGTVGEVLEKKARRHIPEAIMTLLSRLVEAERAAATPLESDSSQASKEEKQGGSAGGGMPRERRAGGEGNRHDGEGRRRPGRRVSFSTFDLSVVDTPDPQRIGSDRPMEGLLTSLFLALKAAERLRMDVGAREVMGWDESPVSKGKKEAGVLAFTVAEPVAPGSWTRREGTRHGGGENEKQVAPLGKENVRQQIFSQWNHPPSPSGVQKPAAHPLPSGGAVEGSRTWTTAEVLARLVQALSDLATAAAAAAEKGEKEEGGEEEGKVAFARSLSLASDPVSPERTSSSLAFSLVSASLLGERPAWSEMAAAAGFYAGELRVLCQEPLESGGARGNGVGGKGGDGGGWARGGSGGSRLLERYQETLSSLVRYELKKVLNLCYCACGSECPEETGLGVGDRVGGADNLVGEGGGWGGREEGGQGAWRAGGVGDPAGDAGGALVGPVEDSWRVTAAGSGGEEKCCSAMHIVAESAPNLQYNNDDPAALFHFALRKVHKHQAVWTEFCEAVLGGGRGVGGEEKQSGGGKEDVALGVGAVDGGVGQGGASLGKGREGEEEGAVSSEAGKRETLKEGGEVDREISDVEQEGCRRGGSKVLCDRAMPPEPPSARARLPWWWSLAETQGDNVLAFLGAASFLTYVLHMPTVVRAVEEGKWGKVERFAGMVSGVLGVVSENDSLRMLADVAGMTEQLDGMWRDAQRVQGILRDTTPEDIVAVLPASHIAGLVRRKRKRVSRALKGQMRDILIWMRSNELPARVVYPLLTPLCVYATDALMGFEKDEYAGDEEEEEEQEVAGHLGLYEIGV